MAWEGSVQARDGVIWAGGHLDLQGPWSQVSGMADSEQELGSHVVGRSLPWGPVGGSVAC